MATVREDNIPHVVRTAHEPRRDGSWDATIQNIEQVNSTIRLIQLGLSSRLPVRDESRTYIKVEDSQYPAQ
jgi:hypothetical protein